MLSVKMNFKRLLWFQTLLFVGLNGAFIIWLLYSLNGYLQTAYVQSLQKVVITPYTIIDEYYKKELSGELTREEAQSKAKEEIRDLRWGDDGKNYFWINTSDPNKILMVMHPYKPKIEGKDLTNFKDKKGNRLFYKMVDTCNKSSDNSGFVRYYWQYKDDANRLESKVSYVKLFKPWGWIVGTGAYECDLKAESWAMIRHFIGIAVVIALVMGLLMIITSSIITGKLTSSLHQLVTRLRNLAVGEADLTKVLETKGVNCSKEINCGQEDCPSYGREARCWYESGSFSIDPTCVKIKSGQLASCSECKLYKKTIYMETDEIATFVNAFINRIRVLISKVKGQGKVVRQEADNINVVSDKMAEATIAASEQSNEIRLMAEQSGHNISSVAQAMEEMTEAINQVSQNTAKASHVAEEATEEADRARAVIENLAQSASKINEISKLIGDIAEQTNLLALNATIEAARAGEAGKGFAVVANEVKELAKQTGDSVEEIDTMVHELQSQAGLAQGAILKSIEVIKEVAELSSNIAASVEEETAVTSEISVNTQAVKEQIEEVAVKSEEIVEANQQTSAGSQEIKNTASKLRSMSEELMKMLDQFKV